MTDLDGMLAQLCGPGALGAASALEHRDLLRAFEALPEEQRAVLLLVGVEDVSYQEAARVLGVPIGRMLLALGLL